MKKLQTMIQQIDGKGYKSYKSLQGNYSFHRYELAIDYVQGDPFAAPSKIRVVIPDAYRPIKEEWKANKQRRIYSEDVIARAVAKAINNNSIRSNGSGKSGLLFIDAPGQEILERSAVTIDRQHVSICLSIGLPANGRRIDGKEAEKLLLKAIPTILGDSIFNMADDSFDEAIRLADQHVAIREKMKENDWISFIADGSILPRKSGVSNEPLTDGVPFGSPEHNRVSFTIPHQKQPITGMALKKGIVLIVGGGYHGKSTLLNAIERGVYHHVRGDGREFVLTDPNAVKVRAEDGRKINTVNISPFISNLPHKQDTTRFHTDNASGSTSQAANVIEALEAGAHTILIDEDTSATNFMIRDQRMQELVADNKEPITPFIDKIKQMNKEMDISTVLVMGGSGDYFDVADQVIMMDQYQPYNVTDKAKAIAEQYPSTRLTDNGQNFGKVSDRQFLPESIQSNRGKKSKIQAKSRTTILMGRTEVSLYYVEQLVDSSQTRMIADILSYLEHRNVLGKVNSLKELLDFIESQLDEKGIAVFSPHKNQHPGDIARPRRFEIAATLNRMRTAKVKL